MDVKKWLEKDCDATVRKHSSKESFARYVWNAAVRFEREHYRELIERASDYLHDSQCDELPDEELRELCRLCREAIARLDEPSSES